MKLSAREREVLLKYKWRGSAFGATKPDPRDASVAASLYRKGVLSRTEACETDRFRGTNNSHRFRFFWIYNLTDAGRAILESLAA